VYYPPPQGAAAGGPLSGTVVILDPGHGGDDPGTCYPYTANCYDAGSEASFATLDEKVVALDVCLYRLLPLLHANGAGVYLTRTTNDQNPDLEARLQLSNYVVGLAGNGPQNVAFVSLHLNGSDDPYADYSQSLYAPHKPHGLAGSVQTMMAARLAPLPVGGDHGLDTFSGHVLRRNHAPALIGEPVFLTNAIPVSTTVMVTRRITTTLQGVAAHHLRLRNVVLTVARQATPVPSTTGQAGRHRARPVYADLRTVRLAALSAATPPAATAPQDAAGAATASPPATASPAAGSEITATLLPTGTLALPEPGLLGGRVVLTVTGDISVTARQTTVTGEGPWLLQAHAHTVAANPDYNTPVLPARLSMATYPYDDREEQIARAMLQGLARFFHRPRLLPITEVRRLNALDPVTAVARGAPAPAPAPTQAAG
jgi:N-acetylmuramoyl-L-alanine amidase